MFVVAQHWTLEYVESNDRRERYGRRGTRRYGRRGTRRYAASRGVADSESARTESMSEASEILDKVGRARRLSPCRRKPTEAGEWQRFALQFTRKWYR
jgi:hypothetical protein